MYDSFMGSDLLILLFMLSPLAGLLFGEWGWALTPLLAFILFPILDALLPKVGKKMSISPKKSASLLLYLYLPYHAFLILSGIQNSISLSLKSTEFWLSALSVGVVTGAIGITFAHEWVHKLKPYQRLYGEWLLVWVCYGHYATEHVFGHHKNVGTREDGATARKNEWLQIYIFRALVQVWIGALKIKPGRTLLHGLVSTLIAIGIGYFFGEKGVIFFLAQSAVAILLLTSIDYVEHYGLERKRYPDGRTEAMKPWHSWDSDTSLMGELLIHLQRHADHHMKPLKPYTDLELLPDAPKLPTGYAGMIWLAWWPHAWFKVMNPKVDQVNARSSG